MKIVVQIITNALAIALAAKIVPGFDFASSADIFTYIIAGLALGLINFFIRPILKIISIPLIIVSLGLFTVFINIAMIWILEYFIAELTITGFMAYLWGVVVISLTNMFVSLAIKKDK